MERTTVSLARRRRRCLQHDLALRERNERGIGVPLLSGDGRARWPLARAPGRAQPRVAHQLQGTAIPAAALALLPDVVRTHREWPRLRSVHLQRGSARPLAYADRPSAFLPGPSGIHSVW